MNRRLQVQNASPEPDTTRQFVFYGASRFEAPECGLVFRREGGMYRIVDVEGVRTGAAELSRAWRFVASCQPVASVSGLSARATAG